jgi:hypothetical protein
VFQDSISITRADAPVGFVPSYTNAAGLIDPDSGSCLPRRVGCAVYFFGGLIMMCAPAVPGYISHGALSLGLVDSPVDSGVAKGT